MMQNAKRLSDALGTKQIPFLSPAITPGSHCPLFGVTMAAPFIQDLAILVVGTSECCWNSKNQHVSNGGKNPFYTYVLEDSEVVFGAAQGVADALRTIWEECHPPAIQLVTSCVPELIGDSAEEIAETVDLPIPILIVHTSHYSSSGYYQGLSSFYSSFLPVMKCCEKKEHAVLLGTRYENFEKSEIYRLFQEAGQQIQIPRSVEDMIYLPEAALLVVMDVTALDAAREIRSKFGTPYVRLDRICRPDEIRSVYREIDRILGTDLDNRTAGVYKKVSSMVAQATVLWADKEFIFAAPFFCPWKLLFSLQIWEWFPGSC